MWQQQHEQTHKTKQKKKTKYKETNKSATTLIIHNNNDINIIWHLINNGMNQKNVPKRFNAHLTNSRKRMTWQFRVTFACKQFHLNDKIQNVNQEISFFMFFFLWILLTKQWKVVMFSLSLSLLSRRFYFLVESKNAKMEIENKRQA